MVWWSLACNLLCHRCLDRDIYAGLWYPVGFALMTFVIGMLFLPETKDRDIYAEDTKM